MFSASVIDDATGVNMGIGFLGVALAFGLTVVAMAYAVGHISGGHFNPAVTLGAALAGRLPWKLTVPYWIAQLVGGVAAGGVLLAIASGRPGYSLAENGLATNGYGELSPAGYSMGAVFLTEALLTEQLFGQHPAAEVLIAERDDVPAGFALFFHGFSTWQGRRGLYLEDLFVRPQFRRRGLAGWMIRTCSPQVNRCQASSRMPEARNRTITPPSG